MATEDGATRLSAKDLERILKVTRALARPSDTTTMLASVIVAGLAVLVAERGSVFRYDAENEERVAKVARQSRYRRRVCPHAARDQRARLLFRSTF